MGRKLSFLTKQMLAYAVILLVFLALMAAALYSYIIRSGRDRALLDFNQLAETTVAQVDVYISHAETIASQVAHDSTVISLMEQLAASDDASENYFAGDTPEREQLLRTLINHNRSKTPASKISVFNLHGDYFCTDPTDERLELGSWFTSQSDLHRTLSDTFSGGNAEYLLQGPVYDPSINTRSGYFFIMFTPVMRYDSDQICGYVECILPMDPLYELLRLNTRTGVQIYLFNHQDSSAPEQIYPTDTAFSEPDANRFYLQQTRSAYGWSILLTLDRQANSYGKLLLFILLAVVLLFSLMLGSFYVIARRANAPILNLSKKVRAVTLDHFPAEGVSTHATDEVLELDRSVDAMIRRLRSAVALEKQAYLHAMQAQMNPHFLYNSLTTISSMAIELDDLTIPKFCDHLAAILRYETAYDDHSVTLSDELKNVRDYLELMRLRYENNFEYEIESDPELTDVPLPRLILQPIAENCFSHAFLDVPPPWHVRIHTYREKNQWVITVQDNGSGFREGRLARLEQEVEALYRDPGAKYSGMKIGGLGLVNTIVRLRLAAEGSSTFSITSQAPTGTIVTLKGPLSHESTDR